MMLLALFWLTSQHVDVDVCRATVFAHHGDKHAGGPSRALGRHVRPTDHGYAHRDVDDWTLAIICHGWRCIIARKIDSGPYGADHNGRWRLKRKLENPGVWRGCVDLTPPAARDLGVRWPRSWSGSVLFVAVLDH